MIPELCIVCYAGQLDSLAVCRQRRSQSSVCGAVGPWSQHRAQGYGEFQLFGYFYFSTFHS